MARQNSSAGRGSSVPAVVLVGLGTFLITIALALVFFVVPAQKKTPLDINATTVTETTQGAVLVGKALAGNTPTEANADRRECREPAGEAPADEGEVVETQDGAEADDSDVQYPVSCFIDNDIPLYSQRRVQAVEPSDADVITMQAAQSLLRADKTGSDGVEGLINATIDRVTVDRVTALPVDEAVSTLQMVAAPTGGDDSAPVGFVRDGMQYKFPFDTEQKDYPYFDASTFTTNPISFVGETTVGGIDAYEFRQELGPIDMWASIRDHFASISSGYDPAVESVLASYRREGMTAGQWGLEGDPERVVDMRRYYTNTRTVYVNPETGQVINGGENIFQYFAEDQEEATAFFEDKAGMEAEKAEPTRTAVRFESGWNEETKAATQATAQESADTLNTFGRVVPAVLGVLGLLALIGGILLGVRSGGRGARGSRVDRAARDTRRGDGGPTGTTGATGASGVNLSK
ncbi:DUF3068 domain-containing protein [Rhodococcus sp. IEGM 1408]|uniref:DUF3068 domain-containing protein n=1 Tax=Rhodococcus sp. IEGM 1408 TaxID=3082220 RepID=UPI002953C595|nr:DUF3068 domain-containing protein [Rhodococcus sp. IEGM 1408]MDV7999710.1 DUF3068 domain-containing protein [Rhodococcus sp. IEGM 1408]